MRVSHCFGACVLLASIMAASASLAAPTAPQDSAVQLSRQNLDSLIQFETAHIVDGNPNQIDPCWLIQRQFFTTANLSEYTVRTTVHYISHGRHITRRQTVSLADVIVVSPNDSDHPHGTFDTSQWVRVRTQIDVSRHPVDANTAIEGHVRLFKADEGEDEGHAA